MLLLFCGVAQAQKKDTVLFIPRMKYQSNRLITKTDSINLLKRKAVLTANSSKELSDRMAELDSILNSYKKESERITKIIKADSINVARTNRKRINVDSLKSAKQVKEDKDAKRLARLNAIIRRNDSIKLVKAQQAADRIAKRKQDSTRIAENKIKLRLRNDSIKTAKAQIAAKNKQDSLRISQRLQKEKFRQDSIQIARAKILADQLAKRKLDSISAVIAQRKQDSINTAIAQQRVQFKADSTRIAQAKIIADQLAQRKQDSINTAIAQQRAAFKADSTRIAQAKIIADQLAQRKQDSISTAIAQQRAAFKADSTRVAQAKIIADQLAQRRQDSINTAVAQQRAAFKADSTRVAQAKIIADQLALRKQDSISTALAQQKAQLRADSTRVAQAKIIADQLALRKQDSISTAIAQQKALFKADSTRVAQAKIIADQLALRKQDSISTALAQQKALFKADSTRVAQAKIIADQLARRKQDSISTALAQQKAQFKADSTRVAQAKIIADQITQRKQDSILTAAVQQKAQLKADSIRIAQQKIIADQNVKRRQDSISTALAQQKAKLRTDSTRIAQAKILEDQIAKRKQDSISNALVLQKAQFKTDSIRIAQEKVIADQLLAKRKQDSINIAIAQQQKTQFKADSIRVAKLISNEIIKGKQDSISNALAQIKIDEARKKQDSIALANLNASNTNGNLFSNDSLDTKTALHSDFEKSEKFIDSMPFIRTGNILSKFVRGEIELKQGQIVSNVLKVINIGRRPITFTTEILIPGAWTRIDDANKKHVATQNDTIIVPIIISPTKLVNGNTEIIINSFIVNANLQQLANNYFSLKTKKNVSWKIELSEDKNMYLKNGENEKRFKFHVHNSGNYKQDLFVNYTIPKKDLYLSDTLGKIIKQPNTTFSLERGDRKEFDYIVNFKDMNKRNYRRVSQESYNPSKVVTKKTHNLIINTSEPRIGQNGLQKRTRVSFIKLPNETKANPYGYPYFPLTVRLSAQNILDDRSFLSMSLRGFKQFSESSNLLYSTDISYSNAYYTNNIFKNTPWYVGYFDEKKSIEVGQISGNIIGVSSSGKGIKGSYKINDQHEVGAFYTNSGGFVASNSIISFGAWHKFIYNENIRLKTQIGRSINSISDKVVNVISFSPRIRIRKKHNLSFTGTITNKSQQNQPAYYKANGLLIGGGYTSNFLKKRLRYNFSTRYNDKNFSSSNFDRLYANQRVTYKINDTWNVFLSNNYQQSSNYNVFTGQSNYSQKTFFNNIVFNSKVGSGNYQTGLFYEYKNYPNSILYNRGLTFRYSTYNYNKNFVSSIYLKAGYTKPELNNIESKDYFNFELSSLTRFRTWNINAKYNLGAFSTLTSQQTLNDFITPQSLRISAQNQYLFPNRHVIIESNAVYSYNNVFSNHTLGIYPTVYYFNKTGWRFGMSANYTFTTSDFSSVFDNLDNQAGNQFNGLNQANNSSFNLNFSLKKDFGIPIPFVDKTAATGNFVAFLDLNGNGIKESEETSLENVVVKVGKKEVLTNIDGVAVIKNILKNEYEFDAFSLERLNGWFPNVEPTIIIENDDIKYVPFVRGIKVYGDVVLDRQKIAVTDDKPTDLSRIKISATKGDKIYNSLTNSQGRFEFYLPFGDYIITMDEAILNGHLKVTRNNIPLKLKNTQDGVYVSFYIIEKRRKVIFTDFTKKKN